MRPNTIGKIAGPMLKNNLERLGIDISVETDALFVDVANKRIGVKTTVPNKELSVVGSGEFTGNLNANNFVGPQITVSGNTISTTASNANLVLSPNGSGVINASAARVVSVADPQDAQDAATKYYVDDRIENHVTTIQAANSSVSVIDAANGNITDEEGNPIVLEPGGLLLLEDGSSTNIAGNIVTTVDGNVVQYARSSGITTLTPVTVQNLTLSSSSVTATAANANLVLVPNGLGTVLMDATTAVSVPKGTTAQRPAAPAAGQTRFNTSTGFLEYYTGTEWINASAQAISVSSQVISGNGVNDTFPLNENTTTAGVIVSINGTIQRPYDAYEVVGSDIVFTETPQPTDTVEVRFVASGYAISELFLPVLSKAAVLSLPSPNVGQTVYVTDGAAGSPCLAVYNGSVWKTVIFGATLT